MYHWSVCNNRCAVSKKIMFTQTLLKQVFVVIILTEYQWLIDFSACAVLVYLITELYYWITPQTAAGEVDLSLIWCFMVILFIMYPWKTYAQTIVNILVIFVLNIQCVNGNRYCPKVICIYQLEYVIALLGIIVLEGTFLLKKTSKYMTDKSQSRQYREYKW